MEADLEKRLSARADREDIFDLVRRERFARDQRHFDVMRACFHDDAHIRSSWFDGGAEDYVKATIARAYVPPELTALFGNSKHWVFPAFLQQNGDRATVESPALIFNRFILDDVEADTQVFCRFFSRVEKRDEMWRLLSFEVLFEYDIMRAVNPRDAIPVDWSLIARYRPSYRFLTYIQEKRGSRVNQNLYGDDRRPELDAFYAAENRWLADGV